MPKTFYILSLGCPKNRVDAEMIWAAAARSGLISVDLAEEADVIIVNTCAFIQSAVEESIDTIVEMGRYKSAGSCSRLVVAGCLSPRYGRGLIEQLPEVDLFVGPAEVGQLGNWLAKEVPPEKFICQSGSSFLPQAATGRVNSLAPGSAYLKVAEGCSRSCSFCVIPRLRGPLQSRSLEDLVSEASNLIDLGVHEIVLVAQDLANWGKDLSVRPALHDLVEALACVKGLKWLRLMYLFPAAIPERLIELIASKKNVLAYLDLPFQHIDGEVLKRMRRGGDPQIIDALIDRLRRQIEDVVIRTSLMTGFPGESEDAFLRLVDFVERSRFERLGVFAFSPEPGSLAAKLAGQVPGQVALRRQEELLAIQQPIALDYHTRLIDKQLPVIVEGVNSEGKLFGRAWNQAPEIDGQTIIKGTAEIGQIITARVVDVGPYDLEVDINE
ncbi:MAG: 30S ribosomal protein S12 methylthiotransferase RimO [Deltaproteobacteria bacterium]|nr:30S ribosomal protein S12 methylthiotransferase RimO [Deltaproteobacteria bacterium]MBW1871730.1 30S ribosomal protein S12 methylthiotransferase RimO [Deltaproteobacteria bacterium]